MKNESNGLGLTKDERELVSLADEMASAREEFIKYSRAVEIAGELHDKLDAKATKTMVLFTNAFIPTLNTVFDEMNKTGGAFEKMFDFGGKAFQGFVYGMRTLVTIVQTLNAAVNLTAGNPVSGITCALAPAPSVALRLPNVPLPVALT